MEKKKGLWTLLSVLLFLGLFMSAAFAGSNFTADGNDRKGKYLYRKNCFKTCHDGSQAKELNPSTKTQAQWTRTFERYQRVECVDEWDKLSQSDLNDVYTYLYSHAYDSPQPATCD